jgi:hypothetical protein
VHEASLMRDRIQEFLDRKGLKEKPPKLVCLVYNGHGMQHGGTVYLLPEGANPTRQNSSGQNLCKPDKEFVALSDVFDACYEFDCHARRLEDRQDVTFVVIVDACRCREFGQQDSASIASSLDPESSKAPVKWALCYSCSRNSVAMDGRDGEHSPFAQGLLDRETGIFAQGVPLKTALEEACRRLGSIAGASGQNPVAVRLDAIDPDFCIAGINDGVATDSDCNELVRFLNGEGLSAIAARFSYVMGLKLVRHFKKLQAEDLDDPDLSFLKRWQKQELIELVQGITARSASIRDSGLDDSIEAAVLSCDDTASEGNSTASESGDDSDSSFEAALAKHPGNPEDFQKHMKRLMQDFLDYLCIIPDTVDEDTETFEDCPGLPDGIWSYCMLVWMRFAKDAYFDGILREKWRECITFPSQDKLVSLLDSCLQQESTRHKCWSRADFERSGCGKQFAAAIFVTDMMVRHSLCWHAESVRMWLQDVVKSWFQNGEDASAFLLRANRFLREHLVNGISVVTLVVETNSYVAFMRMTPLASILLFGYLEARKMADTASSGAAGGRSSLIHGFRMFVSSSKQVFSLTKADVLVLGAKPTVFQGLRCLSRLSGKAWALLGPMKTAGEYVENKAQAVEENSDTYFKATDSEGDDDGSGATARSINTVVTREEPVAKEQTTGKSKKKQKGKEATSDHTIDASKADTAANLATVSDAEMISDEEIIVFVPKGVRPTAPAIRAQAGSSRADFSSEHPVYLQSLVDEFPSLSDEPTLVPSRAVCPLASTQVQQQKQRELSQSPLQSPPTQQAHTRGSLLSKLLDGGPVAGAHGRPMPNMPQKPMMSVADIERQLLGAAAPGITASSNARGGGWSFDAADFFARFSGPSEADEQGGPDAPRVQGAPVLQAMHSMMQMPNAGPMGTGGGIPGPMEPRPGMAGGPLTRMGAPPPGMWGGPPQGMGGGGGFLGMGARGGGGGGGPGASGGEGGGGGGMAFDAPRQPDIVVNRQISGQAGSCQIENALVQAITSTIPGKDKDDDSKSEGSLLSKAATDPSSDKVAAETSTLSTRDDRETMSLVPDDSDDDFDMMNFMPSENEMTGMDPENLHSLLNKISMRQYVDVLKDVGSSDTFLVDGDAFLFWIWEQSSFEIDVRGNQVLYCVFKVLRSLEMLHDRGNFEVFFLRDNSAFFYELGPFWALVRELFFKHLQRFKQEVKVHELDGSWFAESMREYSSKATGPSGYRLLTDVIQSVKPTFILSDICSGIFMQRSRHTESSSGESDASGESGDSVESGVSSIKYDDEGPECNVKRASMAFVIHHLIVGQNVVLLRDLTWQKTRFFAFLLTPSHNGKRTKSALSCLRTFVVEYQAQSREGEISKHLTDLAQIVNTGREIDKRQLSSDRDSASEILVTALRLLFLKHVDVMMMVPLKLTQLSVVLCLLDCMRRQISLHSRCFSALRKLPWHFFDRIILESFDVTTYLEEYFSYALAAVRSFTTASFDETSVDFFDGKLFFVTLILVRGGQMLPEHLLKDSKEIWVSTFWDSDGVSFERTLLSLRLQSFVAKEHNQEIWPGDLQGVLHITELRNRPTPVSEGQKFIDLISGKEGSVRSFFPYCEKPFLCLIDGKLTRKDASQIFLIEDREGDCKGGKGTGEKGNGNGKRKGDGDGGSGRDEGEEGGICRLSRTISSDTPAPISRGSFLGEVLPDLNLPHPVNCVIETSRMVDNISASEKVVDNWEELAESTKADDEVDPTDSDAAFFDEEDIFFHEVVKELPSHLSARKRLNYHDRQRQLQARHDQRMTGDSSRTPTIIPETRDVTGLRVRAQEAQRRLGSIVRNSPSDGASRIRLVNGDNEDRSTLSFPAGTSPPRQRHPMSKKDQRLHEERKKQQELKLMQTNQTEKANQKKQLEHILEELIKQDFKHEIPAGCVLSLAFNKPIFKRLREKFNIGQRNAFMTRINNFITTKCNNLPAIAVRAMILRSQVHEIYLSATIGNNPAIADRVDKFISEFRTNLIGRRWQSVGPTKPVNGKELLNSKLSRELGCKVAFTRKEWEGFEITDLCEDDFIKSGEDYFKPTASSDNLLKGGSGMYASFGDIQHHAHMTISKVSTEKKAAFELLQSVCRVLEESVGGVKELDEDVKNYLIDSAKAHGFYGLTSILGSAPSVAASDSSSTISFQLSSAPEHLRRITGSKDSRIMDFIPDKWQVDLLDVVDAGESVLVVAPTSSGKTFISYYAMEMCLRWDDDGIVIFIAPTKALVNEVYLEVKQRFSKGYRNTNRVIAGRFTREFREDVDRCQILITVPQCLDILLFSARHDKWASRIKNVIVDEVHMIGEEDGEVWERVLVAAPCPIIALSATLGNIEHFASWLGKVERDKGRKLFLVEHSERFNDLQLWAYCASGHHHDSSDTVQFAQECIQNIDPAWIATESLCWPAGFRLLPENCVKLFEDMRTYLPENVRERLEPRRYFPDIEGNLSSYNISMSATFQWEADLKSEFYKLNDVTKRQILENLAVKTDENFRMQDSALKESGEREFIKDNLLNFASTLKHSGMLPAIFFHMSRPGNDFYASHLTQLLRIGEQTARNLEGWEQRLRDLKRRLDAQRRIRIFVGRGEDAALQIAEDREPWRDLYKKIQEHQAVDKRFAFFPGQRLSNDEINEALGDHSIPPYLFSALKRGIGVHHSGLNKYYRRAVEKLCRQKRLGIVFATATLAYGINMPVRTSVFLGDAIYLNAMTYRQMAGRAGRRGTDLRGNVVFFAISSEKVMRLLRSELPSIRGNAVVTSSLVLRVLVKQSLKEKHHTPKAKPSLGQELDNLAHVARRFVQFPIFSATRHGPNTLSHGFLMCCEYLRSEGLIDLRDNGEVMCSDSAILGARIAYMEPANFALIALIRDSVFHGLSERQIVGSMCHIVCQLPIWRSFDYSCHSFVPIEEKVLTSLEFARLRTLSWIAEYACTQPLRVQMQSEFQQVEKLPWTSVMPVRNQDKRNYPTILSRFWSPVTITSGFAALCGRCDEFESVNDLFERTQQGIYFFEDMLPVFEPPKFNLDPYLLNLYTHGQIRTVLVQSGLQVQDLLDRIQDFLVVLRAIITSLEYRKRVFDRLQRNSPALYDKILLKEKGLVQTCQSTEILDNFSSIEKRFRDIRGAAEKLNG